MRFWAGLIVALLLATQAAAQAPEALREEAFQAAQWAMTSDAADALAKVSARFARGNGPLARLAEQREALLIERDRLEAQIEALYAQTGPDGDAARTKARGRHRDVSAALKALNAEIDRAFPDYGDLISPKPLTLAEVQGLLKPDEGLLLVLVDDDAAYIWGVTREAVAWARADGYGAGPIAADVVGLRRHLMGAEGDEAPYDRALAFRVYERLVRPVEAVFAGKTTLISVAEGMLATLPLAVLATDPGSRPDGFLVDRYALAALPAVSSLRSLRCLRATDRPAACRGGVSASRPAPAGGRLVFVGLGAPAGLAPPEPNRAGPPPVDGLFRRGLAQPSELRKLASLPGSATELSALKARYPSGVVLTGAAATETAVKVGHRDEISRSRYVVFSTHGLMAGQMATGEPGLVLTPPDEATEMDDGFLTASEAAQLRLSADFVVLSACNTAASDGSPGSQGLSGLARAFFYAGARSVLVSHWEVSDVATAELIQATFANLDRADLGSRARALQRASITVRGDPRFADPGYWGAFTLVGEPAR